MKIYVVKTIEISHGIDVISIDGAFSTLEKAKAKIVELVDECKGIYKNAVEDVRYADKWASVEFNHGGIRHIDSFEIDEVELDEF